VILDSYDLVTRGVHSSSHSEYWVATVLASYLIELVSWYSNFVGASITTIIMAITIAIANWVMLDLIIFIVYLVITFDYSVITAIVIMTIAITILKSHSS
jgi:hypothetical protein